MHSLKLSVLNFFIDFHDFYVKVVENSSKWWYNNCRKVLYYNNCRKVLYKEMEKIIHTALPEVYAAADFIDSRLVPLKNCEYYTISMQYPQLHMRNAETECLVREEVREMLVKASKALPSGYRLRIWDAWRPFSLQKELYDVYSDTIVHQFGCEGASDDEKQQLISKFVSRPVPDVMIPPVHTTGGAVDVTIIDDKGSELPMGTAFDAFTDMTNTDFFEDKGDDSIRDNRRLLYNAMTSAGFTNLPSEWWHYDYGDRFWAYYNKKPALYKGIFSRLNKRG